MGKYGLIVVMSLITLLSMVGCENMGEVMQTWAIPVVDVDGDGVMDDPVALADSDHPIDVGANTVGQVHHVVKAPINTATGGMYGIIAAGIAGAFGLARHLSAQKHKMNYERERSMRQATDKVVREINSAKDTPGAAEQAGDLGMVAEAAVGRAVLNE